MFRASGVQRHTALHQSPAGGSAPCAWAGVEGGMRGREGEGPLAEGAAVYRAGVGQGQQLQGVLAAAPVAGGDAATRGDPCAGGGNTGPSREGRSRLVTQEFREVKGQGCSKTAGRH